MQRHQISRTCSETVQFLPKKYADSKKATMLEELQRYFPEFQIIVDATEQPIPRPKDKHKRKTYYSGKKKRHTATNQITINLKDKIVHKPSHSPGRNHNYSIFKSKHPVLPEGLQTFVDLGYQGIQNDFPLYHAVLPHKKRKGRKITILQKRFNKMQSKIRIGQSTPLQISRNSRLAVMCLGISCAVMTQSVTLFVG